MPLIGGLLADRYLGTRKAVAFGALLLVAGHLTMAVEGRPATQSLTYAGQTYEFQVEGRGEDAASPKIVVGDKPYERGGQRGGRLGDQEPAGSSRSCRSPSCPRASYKHGR